MDRSRIEREAREGGEVVVDRSNDFEQGRVREAVKTRRVSLDVFRWIEMGSNTWGYIVSFQASFLNSDHLRLQDVKQLRDPVTAALTESERCELTDCVSEIPDLACRARCLSWVHFCRDSHPYIEPPP